jgi:hypothetical protein
MVFMSKKLINNPKVYMFAAISENMGIILRNVSVLYSCCSLSHVNINHMQSKNKRYGPYNSFKSSADHSNLKLKTFAFIWDSSRKGHKPATTPTHDTSQSPSLLQHQCASVPLQQRSTQLFEFVAVPSSAQRALRLFFLSQSQWKRIKIQPLPSSAITLNWTYLLSISVTFIIYIYYYTYII